MSVAISARSVQMTYNEDGIPVHALKDASLEVSTGEFALLMGPSGSGKTSLLCVLGGLLTPTRGGVVVLGQELTTLDRRARAKFRLDNLGFIFQGFNLFGALTASENVELALSAHGYGGAEARRRACELLDRLGIGGQAKRRPRDLAGGEKQRVAIARALAGEPRVILADEPTSSLDAGSGGLVVEILRDLARERGTTVLIASHDVRIARVADKVMELDDGRL